MSDSRDERRTQARARPGRRARYHHGNLADALVTTTLAMIEQGGVQSISLREVARRAGVSSGAPFRHFENKEALLLAVAERGAQRLNTAMQRAASGHEDPLDRFRAMGVAYVVWAVRHPALFSLLHSPQLYCDDVSHSIGLVEREQRDMIVELVTRGPTRARADDAQAVLLAAHALVHGLARLLIDRVFTTRATSPARARQLALEVTGVLGRGLGAAAPP